MSLSIVVFLILVATLHGISLHNRTRLVTTILEEPYLMFKRNHDGNSVFPNVTSERQVDPSMFEGYCADLAHAIYNETLKIPYKFLIETKYGRKHSDGVWDGMIGALIHGRADSAIAPLTITEERLKVVDFTQPFLSSGISMLTYKYQKSKPGWFFFLAPLSPEVWLCVLLAYVGVRLIFLFIDRLSAKKWNVNDEIKSTSNKEFSICSVFCIPCVGSVHQRLSRSISGQLALGVWYFFSLVFLLTYIATFINISPFLPSRWVLPVERAEDLLKQNYIRYGTLINGSSMNFFRKSTLEMAKNMWNEMQQHSEESFISSNSDGIERVRRSKGKFVYFLESRLNEYVNGRFPCDTMRIGENLNTVGYGIGTPRGSDLHQPLNLAITQLNEIGFLKQLEEKWFNQRNECFKEIKTDGRSGHAINLNNLTGLFFLLIIGLLVALFIAFLEFLFQTKRQAIRSQQSYFKVLQENIRVVFKGSTDNRHGKSSDTADQNKPINEIN